VQYRNQLIYVVFIIIFCLGIFSTPAGKRYQQLLQQVEKLQEENFKIDAGRN
jgi:hypothetical protein